MTSASTLGTPALPTLPHWETPPADLTAAIREIKAALRARIAASGRTVEEVFAVVEARVAERVGRDRGRRRSAARRSGRSSTTPTSRPAPSPPTQLAKLRRRGCLVVRGHFPREQATGLGPRHRRLRREQPVLRELPRPGRRLLRQRRLQARDLPDLLVARRRCRPARATGWRACRPSSTRQWTHESDGVQWFDPDRDSLYPDRIRRRPPGADSGGLGTHLDPGTLDLWMTAGLPEGVPAPVRRHRRAVRPLGRRPPHRRPAVPRHHDVLGVPHLPGLDRAVRHGPRPGRPAHRPDPRGDGLPHAPPAAGRRARRRHVRRHRQPGLPRQREVAPAAHAGGQRHPRRPGRRLRLVALRHDPQRRAGRPTRRAGATSCTSPPPRGARATRPTPPASARRSSPVPARATSPTSTTSAPGPTGSPSTTSTRPADAASASTDRPDEDMEAALEQGTG